MKKLFTFLTLMVLSITLMAINAEPTYAADDLRTESIGYYVANDDYTCGWYGGLDIRATMPSFIPESEIPGILPIEIDYSNIPLLSQITPTEIYVNGFSYELTGPVTVIFVTIDSGDVSGSNVVLDWGNLMYETPCSSSGFSYYGPGDDFIPIQGDTTPPLINGATAVYLVNVDNPVSVNTFKSTLTATDETDGDVTSNITVTSDAYTGNEDTLGDYNVQFSVTDSANNTSSVTVIFRVVDVVDPLINLVGGTSINIEYGTSWSDPGYSCNDNYDPTCTVSTSGTVNDSVLGSYTLYYDATDSSGNTATQRSRTVIVQDTTPPTITLSGNSTIYVEYGDSFTDPGATATDIHDGNVQVGVSGTVDTNTLGSYTLTYYSQDDRGNTALEVTRTVIVRDTTDPVVTLNGDSTVYVEYGGSYTELGAEAYDEHTGSSPTNIGGDTVDPNTVGTYVITYSSTDYSGNIGIATRTVIVQDTVIPIITLSGSSTVYVEFGQNYTEQGATWEDSILGTLDADISGSVNVGVLGTYTIYYNATDINGNTATEISRTVIVRDTTDPVFSGNTAYSSNIGSPLSIADIMNGISATDLHDGDMTSDIVITTDNYSGNETTPGTYSIVLTVTDSSANSSTMSITITVSDNSLPVFNSTEVLYTLEEANAMTLQDIKDHFGV